jgi:LAO/AO transport system kinase
MGDTSTLINSILQGLGMDQRRAMAKAITLLESTRPDHRLQADELLTSLLPHTGNSFRIGLSGVPGVGKSTLIEALGLMLIAQGHKVAVLAIDPSSTVSGGSILGDKTRMEQLSVHPHAFIRPSPSSGTLGGVAEKTRECMLVLEAAGYDIVIVETVGVGQSETAVANMTDMFVLMQLPNAGDDLQAIKKGVMELADLVLINKADLDPEAASRAQAFIRSAMQLLHGGHGHPSDKQPAHWTPDVLNSSALKGEGLQAFWTQVLSFKQLQLADGQWVSRRHAQSLSWMNDRIEAGLKQAFQANTEVSRMLPKLKADVLAGKVAASTAARQLLAAWHPSASQ